MKCDPRWRFGRYARFAVGALAATIMAGLIGYLPTMRMWGTQALPAMWAGCGVSLIAGLIGGAVQFVMAGGQPDRVLGATGIAMGLRFGLAVILGTAAALSGLFDRAPLLIWLGLSYLVLLPFETRFALRSIRKPS